MVQFSHEECRENGISDNSGSRKIFRKRLRIDEKGRIVLPISLRKALLLEEGEIIEIVFTLSDTKALLVFYDHEGSMEDNEYRGKNSVEYEEVEE